MLYTIAHWLRAHCNWMWEVAEDMNSVAFGMRYRKPLRRIEAVIADYAKVRVAVPADAERLALFFDKQPESAFEFFRPHAFDEETLSKLIGRKSFLMFVVEEEGVIVGYFFLRSFVHGVCYLGKMVDHEHQGQGIGKRMCKAAMDVAVTLGLRMFESINRNNMASMRSTGAVLKQVVLEELEHGDLLLEDLPLEDPRGS